MIPSRCPDERTLAAFDAGAAAWPVLEQVAEHVASCPGCERQLERLRTPDDWVVVALHTFTRSTTGGTPGAARPAANPPVLPGYELLDLLGEGGMSAVYRARDPRLQRLVAVKVLLCSTGRRLERFQAEARAVARLQHPNIVQIFDVGEHGGVAYLVLELVEGGGPDMGPQPRPLDARLLAGGGGGP